MLSLSMLKSFLISLLDSTNCFPRSSIAFICFLPLSSIVFICFPEAFTKGEYLHLGFSISLLWSDDNISSPVRYPYLSIFPDHNADIFVASLLMSYCSFWSLILLSIALISFYILSERFFLKRKRLFDARIGKFSFVHLKLRLNSWCSPRMMFNFSKVLDQVIRVTLL